MLEIQIQAQDAGASLTLLLRIQWSVTIVRSVGELETTQKGGQGHEGRRGSILGSRAGSVGAGRIHTQPSARGRLLSGAVSQSC